MPQQHRDAQYRAAGVGNVTPGDVRRVRLEHVLEHDAHAVVAVVARGEHRARHALRQVRAPAARLKSLAELARAAQFDPANSYKVTKAR